MAQPNQTVYSVPSVQQYVTAPEGQWTLNPGSKMLILENALSSKSQVLTETVRLVRDELAAFAAKLMTSGGSLAAELLAAELLPIETGPVSAAAEGDLVVELAGPDEAGAFPPSGSSEGYIIEIGSYARVKAPTERAVMYGLRTILQQLAARGELPYGTIVDYPAVGERALHIDIGRKFYTKEWIIERVKELSWLKLNVLQLHFSENEGFTLECESHPEVMSPQFLTKEELREILRAAGKYHVTVIPSLDSPGHLGQALKKHPEWLLKDSSGTPAKGALDLTNREARQFVLDLLGEYAELFKDSPYFHIGGDEFIDFEQFSSYPQLEQYAKETLGIPEGQGVDTYIHYINEAAGYLEDKGFTVRAWNDGLYRQDQHQHVNPKASIEITYWTKWHKNMAPAQTFMDKGCKLINYNDAYFYYVLGENAGYKYPTGEKIYADWHPGLLPRVSETEKQEYAQPYPSSLLGCSFSIWCDTPDAQTEEQVASGIFEPLRAMAEKAWTAEKRHASYEAFKQLFNKAGAI
ncbi:beta-N-acetylhexosaminidase [Paenibacillus pinistramenti]|uniref:beta-N-acetylhexosaminidase n=1 Tax=Paenibacillus pinistramenti TaxID=1768003 RepID=UPI001EEFD587|nr:glycoside hydrolase family 20 protein [Paenibacillus pinistramenti]